jgi:hypothetical protein
MYQNFIIPYLYEAQHVSGDTPPIIRSLKLHWQLLEFYTWKVGKVVGRVVGGRCQAHTAHHQESKTALSASGFSYVEGWEGCWTCSWWTLSGTLCLTTSTNYTSNNLPRMKTQRLPVHFRLLMMGGVSSETC